MDWFIRARDEKFNTIFENIHGILVPGGFGERGSEGKILSIKYARKYYTISGICLYADGCIRLVI